MVWYFQNQSAERNVIQLIKKHMPYVWNSKVLSIQNGTKATIFRELLRLHLVQVNRNIHWQIERGHLRACHPKGPDSFVLSCIFFETKACRWLVPPTTGIPGSTTVRDKIRFTTDRLCLTKVFTLSWKCIAGNIEAIWKKKKKQKKTHTHTVSRTCKFKTLKELYSGS